MKGERREENEGSYQRLGLGITRQIRMSVSEIQDTGRSRRQNEEEAEPITLF